MISDDRYFDLVKLTHNNYLALIIKKMKCAQVVNATRIG